MVVYITVVVKRIVVVRAAVVVLRAVVAMIGISSRVVECTAPVLV